MTNASSTPAPGNGAARVVMESLTHASPATEGYRLNHTMLRISNPENSLRFYTEFMGMSLILKINAGPFTAYYLGYPGPEDKTPADMAKSMRSRAGLLELVHVPSGDGLIGTAGEMCLNQPAFIGFGHLGFYVPSVEETLERAAASNYTVVKTLDDISTMTLDLPASLSDIPVHPEFLASFSQVGIIRDPDGYSIEILPQHWKK